MKQAREDMRNAGKAGLTSRKPEMAFEEMLNSIGHSLSDIASSKNGVVVEDKDDDAHDTELGKLSEADQYGCMMDTTSKTVEHRLKPFQQKEICHEQLKHPGQGNMADVVTPWSLMADSPVSTLHRTSPSVHKEVLTNCGSRLRRTDSG
jgi:hypothetical protein